MVLCSDGIWDAISREEVAHPNPNPYSPNLNPDPNPNPNLTLSLTTGRPPRAIFHRGAILHVPLCRRQGGGRRGHQGVWTEG